MLTCGKNVFFAFILGLSSQNLLANSKTLLINGVNAAVHGDISMDKGEWRNNDSFSALRIKAGFQLIRVGFAAVTVGYQKVGFYTAQKNWTQGGANKDRFDYRGPVAEFHLFPDALFSFSVAGHKGDGFSFRSGASAESFPISCPKDDAACAATDLERSRLQVSELMGQVNWMFKPQLQLFIGAGSRRVTGSPDYIVARKKGDVTVSDFESFGSSSWNIDSKFVVFGIRGSTL